MAKIIIKKCIVCGKYFEATAGNARYCSKECKYIAFKQNRNNNNNRETEFSCAWCGKTFISQRKKKYCSKECRMSANGQKVSTKTKINTYANAIVPGSLADVVQKARDAGLSYGQYTGQIYAKQIRIRKEVTNAKT